MEDRLFGGTTREWTRYVSIILRFERQDANYEQLLTASSALTKTFEAIAAAFMEKRLFLSKVLSHVEAVLATQLLRWKSLRCINSVLHVA